MAGPHDWSPRGGPKVGFRQASPRGGPRGAVHHWVSPRGDPTGGPPRGIPRWGSHHGRSPSGGPHVGLPRGVPQGKSPKCGNSRGFSQCGSPKEGRPSVFHQEESPRGVPQVGFPMGAPQTAPPNFGPPKGIPQDVPPVGSIGRSSLLGSRRLPRGFATWSPRPGHPRGSTIGCPPEAFPPLGGPKLGSPKGGPPRGSTRGVPNGLPQVGMALAVPSRRFPKWGTQGVAPPRAAKCGPPRVVLYGWSKEVPQGGRQTGPQGCPARGVQQVRSKKGVLLGRASQKGEPEGGLPRWGPSRGGTPWGSAIWVHRVDPNCHPPGRVHRVSTWPSPAGCPTGGFLGSLTHGIPPLAFPFWPTGLSPLVVPRESAILSHVFVPVGVLRRVPPGCSTGSSTVGSLEWFPGGVPKEFQQVSTPRGFTQSFSANGGPPRGSPKLGPLRGVPPAVYPKGGSQEGPQGWSPNVIHFSRNKFHNTSNLANIL
jgi:hypothetical protein